MWKDKSLKFQENIPRHQYSISHVMLWTSAVLSAATGLRSTGKIVGTFTSFLNISKEAPSWYTGRLWLMRLGYYKLNRPKEKADDWVWIIDHSIQLSSEKFLVILGIRLCNLPSGRALNFSDVEPIELIPVKKSNGEIVYHQLENAIKKTGIPRQIIADHGGDIKPGIENFCRKYDKTCYVYDIKHAMSILLKKEIKNEDDWGKLVTNSVKTKREIYQTGLAPLVPPNQRKKSRYMNADTLFKWAEKIRIFLTQSDEAIEKYYDSKKVREKFSWVESISKKIEQWNNLIILIESVENFIRNNGLNFRIFLELETRLNELNLDARAIKFKASVMDFLKKEALKANADERLLGSSEIIESLFGKQKYIEKEQSRSGFTGLLLVLPALVAETSEIVIKKALELTPTKFVIDWYQKNITKSVQAKRIATFATSVT